jgi:excisionase family DNA binding protein
MHLEFLNTEELARRLGVSQRHIEAMRLRGDGPPFLKLGRSIRYLAKEVDAWASSNLRRSTSDHSRNY